MKGNVSARGYTNVLLVLNMKRFIREQDQGKFEKIRGREEFAKALRENWPKELTRQETFITIQEDKQRRGRPEEMTTEQIGFATGIFRSLMLERYTFPLYALDKEKVVFDDDLMTNFQFKTLFLRAWNNWSVYIRPTFTGFFVIRLTNRHLERPRSFIKLARDVLLLQESLDIRSAQNWLKDAQARFADNTQALGKKKRSIKAFLAWLGVDETYSGNLSYYPLQWRLAMEACGLFVKAVGSELQLGGQSEPIRLVVPKPSLSIPLHESYVVHHFTELLASESMVKKSKSNESSENPQMVVDLNDVRQSPHIRQALANLLEGSVLRVEEEMELEDTTREVGYSFPPHRWSLVDKILEHNLASWNDELCLLNPRTAIIMPAKKWQNYEMSVSSVPGATLRVKYPRYWGAIERMIEFLVEIRVLAQLLESASYDLLGEIAERIHQTRSMLFSGDIKIDERLPDLVASAASLRHQAALCQSLSHPQLWSRADFAILKANHLLDQLGTPKVLEHIERNINSIVEFVNHIDELYIADLSEKSNENANWLSMVLAAASLTLTILILPSFWADIGQLATSQYRMLVPVITTVGNWLAVFLIGSAVFLFGVALFQRTRIQRSNQSFLKRLRQFTRRNRINGS